MTSARYSVYACDPFGARLADLSNFHALSYARVVNGWSTLKIQLPTDINTAILRIPDGRIEIWRRLPNGREYLDTETIWLIKAIERQRNENGQETIIVEADTPLSVIGDPGLIVDAWAGTSDAEYSAAPADTQIRNVVNTAFLGGNRVAAVNVDFTDYITVPTAPGLGASIAKAFAWRNVLKVCQEFAEASAAQGVYIAFDIVAPTPSTLEFRTYAQQRGTDHRFPNGQNPVILSPAFGNLAETTLRYDYRDVASYVMVGGKGEGINRVVTTAYDETLLGVSPFGIREVFTEYTNTGTVALLQQEAYAELRSRRPRKTLRGKIVQTPDALYGVQWGWGDFVTCQDFGESFDCRIDAITVTVENGQETVEAWLRGETTT